MQNRDGEKEKNTEKIDETTTQRHSHARFRNEE